MMLPGYHTTRKRHFARFQPDVSAAVGNGSFSKTIIPGSEIDWWYETNFHVNVTNKSVSLKGTSFGFTYNGVNYDITIPAYPSRITIGKGALDPSTAVVCLALRLKKDASVPHLSWELGLDYQTNSGSVEFFYGAIMTGTANPATTPDNSATMYGDVILEINPVVVKPETTLIGAAENSIDAGDSVILWDFDASEIDGDLLDGTYFCYLSIDNNFTITFDTTVFTVLKQTLPPIILTAPTSYVVEVQLYCDLSYNLMLRFIDENNTVLYNLSIGNIEESGISYIMEEFNITFRIVHQY